MSQMNHAAFAQGGIQELSFGEVDLVGGADAASDLGDTMTWIAAGAAMVAGVATVTAPATVGTSGVVAGGAAVVSGLAAAVAVVAYAVSED